MSVPNPANEPDHAAASQLANLAKRLAFLGLGEPDAERLHAMAADFRVWADDFVEAFYRHLFAFEETARFLQSPEVVSRLKVMQRDHLQSMLQADWSEHFFRQRRQLGHVHAEVGIEPQYFLGAFNQYLRYSLERLAEKHPHDTEAYKEQALSLLKAVFLDIGLTLDAYFAQSTRNLRHALDMFWRANAELRQFAHLTSHDLKTPLATVANLCDEALDEFGDQMPQPARDLVAAAKDRTFRMSRMIDELLAFTLPQEDERAHDEVSCQEALDEAIDAARMQLAKSQIEVTVIRSLPRVPGSKVRLREIFTNLLTNAAKFIDRRPGLIVIDAEEIDEGWLITVTDNGPGIPADEQERVFAPFRRLAMHRDRPGSGLGLYFAKNLVTQLGGRIWVDSAPGGGSRFCIQLPRSYPAPPSD